jgi:hypothetical protein
MMKGIKRISLSILAIALILVSTAKAEEVCKVTDPTGAPLNVRATPNGKIVRTISNGSEVYIEETASDDKGRPWAKISVSTKGKKRTLGWVLREFISCYQR